MTPLLRKMIAVTAIGVALAGCSNDDGEQVSATEGQSSEAT